MVNQYSVIGSFIMYLDKVNKTNLFCESAGGDLIKKFYTAYLKKVKIIIKI